MASTASAATIEKQLMDLGFRVHGWGRSEVKELQNIILPEEEIYECVNGLYEGGFALLLATDVRVLLVDKKPLNYLTVEDLRFDMINEIDYSHRLFGAYIKISAGETSLKFNSVNQHRLRKLIGHVQQCMAEAKKQQATHPHLEQINQQLQSYLLAQYQQQQKLQEQLQEVKDSQTAAAPLPSPDPDQPRPSPELADYLFARSLMARHLTETGRQRAAAEPATAKGQKDQLAELYAEGFQEVFGKHDASPPLAEINPLHVAYSKLPQALRNRKFGRPSFHAHAQESVSLPTEA
jgi:hypothetical protein